MTRTFGLELVESVLSNFSSVFFKVGFSRCLMRNFSMKCFKKSNKKSVGRSVHCCQKLGIPSLFTFSRLVVREFCNHAHIKGTFLCIVASHSFSLSPSQICKFQNCSLLPYAVSKVREFFLNRSQEICKTQRALIEWSRIFCFPDLFFKNIASTPYNKI